MPEQIQRRKKIYQCQSALIHQRTKYKTLILQQTAQEGNTHTHKLFLSHSILPTYRLRGSSSEADSHLIHQPYSFYLTTSLKQASSRPLSQATYSTKFFPTIHIDAASYLPSTLCPYYLG